MPQEPDFSKIIFSTFEYVVITFAKQLVSVLIGPIGITIVAAIIVTLALKRLERRLEFTLFRGTSLSAIDRMDGRTFERYCRAAFERLGYAVELTPYARDHGADLVLQKDGERTVVQVKRWSRPVGVKAVQEAVASKAMYKAAHALVVSNRTFTSAAEALAAANNVELWDRTTMVRLIKQFAPIDSPPDASQSDRLTGGSAGPTTCPRCGATMVRRRSKYGAFLGCSTYPRCRQIIPLPTDRVSL